MQMSSKENLNTFIFIYYQNKFESVWFDKFQYYFKNLF